MSVALLEREAGIHGVVVMGAGGVLMPRVLGEGRLKLPA
jgi:tRNA A22 N-methylase